MWAVKFCSSSSFSKIPAFLCVLLTSIWSSCIQHAHNMSAIVAIRVVFLYCHLREVSCIAEWNRRLTCESVMVWRNRRSGAVRSSSTWSGRCFASASLQHTAASDGALLSHVLHAWGVWTSGASRPALSRLLPRPPSTTVGQHLVR